MGRLSKHNRPVNEIALEEVKQKIRGCIDEKYGGVAPFLKSEDGIELGGTSIRPYLYDKGAINFKVLEQLCDFFGIGRLGKKTIVKRTVIYTLDTDKS